MPAWAWLVSYSPFELRSIRLGSKSSQTRSFVAWQQRDRRPGTARRERHDRFAAYRRMSGARTVSRGSSLVSRRRPRRAFGAGSAGGPAEDPPASSDHENRQSECDDQSHKHSEPAQSPAWNEPVDRGSRGCHGSGASFRNQGASPGLPTWTGP